MDSRLLRFFLPASLLMLSLSSWAQEIRFTDPKYNFGFVREGDTVRMEFEFRNIGTEPLYIQNYEVECGCTVMEAHPQKVDPGASSVLKVTFDTNNKLDRQDRIVKVISNAVNSPAELRFKGVVLRKKDK